MANIVLNYQYHLTNVDWTNDYNNAVKFFDKAARNSYFNVATIFADPNYNLFNFNITNLYKTTVVIDCNDYIEAMQSNYLIVKDNAKNEYYFYFITNVKQINFNRIELSIELDIFQQYFYDVDFVDAPINRCKYPLNPKSGTKYYLSDDPIVYNAEDYNPLQFFSGYNKPKTNKEGLIANLCYGFMYVFVDPTYKFEFYDMDGQQDDAELIGYTTKPDGIHGIQNNIGVLCFPIYTSAKRFKLNVSTSDDTYNFSLDDAAVILEKLKEGHSGADAGHIYSVKISRRIPFRKTFIDSTISGSAQDDLNITCAAIELNPFLLLNNSDVAIVRIGTYHGIRIINDSNQEYEYQFSPATYDVSPLQATNEYDPKTKMHIAQYEKCYIDFGDGNKMEFDLTQAIERGYQYNNITMYYKEAIVPDITRYSATFNAFKYTGGIANGARYANETFTSDMSLIFTIDQWSEFLANNKNFYAQGNFNTMMKLNKGVVGGAIAAGQMNYLKAGSSLVSMYADTLQFVKNREFQVDNMRASVDRIINQNGNACFNLLMHGIQPVFTYYSTNINDRIRIEKQLKMYGINTVGLIGNIKNYMDVAIGWDYCYIQADVNELYRGVGISLECEKALLKIFNNGVRLWRDPNTMYNF